MARPIPLHLAPRDSRDELGSRLQQAPLDHAEAVLAGYEVLQLLHDRGVLELARGTLGGGEKILEQVVACGKKAVGSKEYPPNLIVLGTIMCGLDHAIH